MSDQALDALRPTLDAIPDADVHRPELPPSVAHQEAHDLLQTVSEESVRQGLLDVGLDEALLDGLPTAIDASRQAQSKWVVVRDASKPQAQKEREARGADLRSDLVATCRWNLRDNALVQGALDQISDGGGVADLIQDLHDLAVLVRANLPAFESDQTFDAPAEAEQALALSQEIGEGLSQARTSTTQRQAVGLRDRAATHLDDVVGEIREAGRYAFRGVAEMEGRFGSAYIRRRTRTYRRRKQQDGDDEGSET